MKAAFLIHLQAECLARDPSCTEGTLLTGQGRTMSWIRLGLSPTQNPAMSPRAKVGLPAQGTNTANSVTPRAYGDI